MKKSLVALLIMVGLVGGMFIAGCGGGGESDTDTTMNDAMQKAGDDMEKAAEDVEEKADDMKNEMEGAGGQ